MHEIEKRVRYIRKIFSPCYVAVAVLGTILYLLVSLSIIVYIHNSLGSFYQGMYLHYTIPYTIFTIIISVLFGITIAMFVEKINEIRLKSAGFGVTGIMFGALAAGCPGCFFGLFPFFLSFFGISATLAILPFNGLEFQGLAIVALLITIYTLAKETDVSCKT